MLAVAAGAIGGAPAARGSSVDWLFPPSLECVTSLNLTVEVENTAALAGELVPADVLERRILKRAAEVLAKAGVTSDPQASEVRLYVASPAGGESAMTLAPSQDAQWASTRVVRGEDEDEPATAENVEAAAIALLSDELGRSERCGPTRSASANGRFELELPPDNPRARARYLGERLGPEAGDESEDLLWGFLFERPDRGPEELRAVIRLPRSAPGQKPLVSNDGRFVVVIGESVHRIEIDLAAGLPIETPRG